MHWLVIFQFVCRNQRKKKEKIVYSLSYFLEKCGDILKRNFLFEFFRSKKEISVFFRNVCERILNHRRNYLQFVIFLLCVFATAGHVFFQTWKKFDNFEQKNRSVSCKKIKSFFCGEDKKGQSFIRREKRKKSLFCFFYNHLLPIW